MNPIEKSQVLFIFQSLIDLLRKERIDRKTKIRIKKKNRGKMGLKKNIYGKQNHFFLLFLLKIKFIIEKIIRLLFKSKFELNNFRVHLRFHKF